MSHDLRLTHDYGTRYHRHRMEGERQRIIDRTERYRQATDRPTHNSEAEEPYMNSNEWTDRLHEGFDYEYLHKRIRDNGIWVRTRVQWLTTMEQNTQYQLLAITVKPMTEHGEYFPTRRSPNPWSPYHVSICFNTDPHTSEDIDYLIKHFHNKALHLQVVPSGGITGTMLQLDPARDPIASDPIVRNLFYNGYYRNKHGGIHISM